MKKVKKEVDGLNSTKFPILRDLPTPREPIIVTTVFSETDGVEQYKGVAVGELLRGSLEETIWLLWTGNRPTKVQIDLTRLILIMVADHGPVVAGAYATILATSAGLYMPQAVAAGVQMIGPRFGGAAGLAAANFLAQVEPKSGQKYPGFGHKIFSRSRPDKRVATLTSFAKKNLKSHNYLNFALKIETELLTKNDKLILNIDGAIGAVLLDAGFPVDGIDGFFVLARTIGLIAHYIDQKERGTGLIRLPEELVMYKQK